jgi:hypothetical protein
MANNIPFVMHCEGFTKSSIKCTTQATKFDYQSEKIQLIFRPSFEINHFHLIKTFPSLIQKQFCFGKRMVNKMIFLAKKQFFCIKED